MVLINELFVLLFCCRDTINFAFCFIMSRTTWGFKLALFNKWLLMTLKMIAEIIAHAKLVPFTNVLVLLWSTALIKDEHAKTFTSQFSVII